GTHKNIIQFPVLQVTGLAYYDCIVYGRLSFGLVSLQAARSISLCLNRDIGWNKHFTILYKVPLFKFFTFFHYLIPGVFLCQCTAPYKLRRRLIQVNSGYNSSNLCNFNVDFFRRFWAYIYLETAIDFYVWLKDRNYWTNSLWVVFF